MREDRASETALLVQQAILFSATRWSTAHLVSEASRDASIRLLSRLPRGRELLRELETPRRWRVAMRERLVLPGILVHHALRKRWIEERVREAIAGGAGQLVNLGAGFDTLALRLASDHDDLRFIEIDHPATQSAKAQALRGEPARSRLELLPVDFTQQTLRERLPEAASFDPTVPTVVVCEGVLPYLDVAEARALFASLVELFGAGVTVIFTFVAERSPTGRQPFGPLLKVMLTVWGESVRLRIEPEALRELVEGEGLTVSTITQTEKLLETYGAEGYRGLLHDLEMHAVAQIP